MRTSLHPRFTVIVDDHFDGKQRSDAALANDRWTLQAAVAAAQPRMTGEGRSETLDRRADRRSPAPKESARRSEEKVRAARTNAGWCHGYGDARLITVRRFSSDSFKRFLSPDDARSCSIALIGSALICAQRNRNSLNRRPPLFPYIFIRSSAGPFTPKRRCRAGRGR
jgi:hypothetical protein